jgi:nitroimidazol reductase NimA-like FMN-containing flavoprotein (pyridoxamine 5'-phosphate oxidase superfamily)
VTGDLDERGIDALLRSESRAHLACVLPDGWPYVVPIAYAYDGFAFYAYSADGLKLDALRRQPRACIAVDHVIDAATWTSVIAWGTFRELDGLDAADAVARISARLHTVAAADAASDAAEHTYVARIAGVGVTYRIDVTERSGRYSTAGG